MASEDFSDDDVARLQRGEILLQTIHEEKSGAAARVSALFHASADVVWEIIGYCKYQVIYVQGMSYCEMLSGDQYHMIMRHRIRSSWYTPTMDFTFEAKRDASGYGVAHLVDGDLKVMEGSWKLSPFAVDGGLLVVHESRIKPAIPAPKWLIRRSLQKDLPDMLACIRGLAGASGNDSRIEADLKQCPGEITPESK